MQDGKLVGLLTRSAVGKLVSERLPQADSGRVL